jgi:hypothetical protein
MIMELLAQLRQFDEVSIAEVDGGYVVEINDTEGMPLALDELLDELEEQCLEVIDAHELGCFFVFDGFEIAVLLVGDYD